MRRRHRQKLNPQQEKLKAASERSNMRRSVLVSGIAKQMEHCYDLSDFTILRDLINTEVAEAFQLAHDTYQKYLDSRPWRRNRTVRVTRRILKSKELKKAARANKKES